MSYIPGRRMRMPSTVPPEVQARNSARQKARWEAQDAMAAAWRLGGNPFVEHSAIQIEEAIKLYEHARKLWEMLGDQAAEVTRAQHAIDACRMTLAAQRATDAIRAATGSDK